MKLFFAFLIICFVLATGYLGASFFHNSSNDLGEHIKDPVLHQAMSEVVQSIHTREGSLQKELQKPQISVDEIIERDQNNHFSGLKNRIQTDSKFKENLYAKFKMSRSSPLNQRIKLLNAILAVEENKTHLESEVALELRDLMKEGQSDQALAIYKFLIQNFEDEGNLSIETEAFFHFLHELKDQEGQSRKEISSLIDTAKTYLKLYRPELYKKYEINERENLGL